jgi:hypothetical protein
VTPHPEMSLYILCHIKNISELQRATSLPFKKTKVFENVPIGLLVVRTMSFSGHKASNIKRERERKKNLLRMICIYLNIDIENTHNY